MAQISNEYLQLNDDGTPRRKHDIEERDARRPIFFSVAGFVFFNAFALLKTIWFGDDDARADSYGRAGGGSQDVPQIVVDATGDPGAVPAHEPADADASDAGDPEDLPTADYVRGSGLKFALTSLDLNFSDTGAIATARLGAPLAWASNDNISLYGAAPGRAIVLQDGAVGGAAGGASASAAQISPLEDDDGEGEGGEGSDEDASGGSEGSSGGTGGGGSSSDPRSNRLPVVSNVVLLSTLLINEARSLELSDLLQHASDADGDELNVVNVKASVGHVVAKADGGWLYIPEFNDRSVVEFTYDIKDGHGSVAQKAYISLVAGAHVPLSGTEGDDDLASEEIDELIAHIVDAGAGNDTVRTGSGDDVVYGSSGDDYISTGAGNDVIYAGDGNDVVDAGSGDDYVLGEGGNDHLRAESGNDRLEGGTGDDLLDGGDGNDVLIGGQGDDHIDGGGGNDLFFGMAGDGQDVMSGASGIDAYIAHTADGDDHFNGGEGDDVYRSALGDGADVVEGDSGHDVFYAVDAGSGDTFDGGEGCDTYDASAVETAVIIDLNAGAVYLLTDVDLIVMPGEAADLPDENGVAAADVAEPLVVAVPLSDSVDDDSSDQAAVQSAVAGDQNVLPAIYDPVDTATPDLLVDVESAVGGRGDDIIIAGDAVNELAGGEGDDTFVFQTVASTGSGKGSRDKILDFEVGDRINIDDIGEEFEDDFNNVFDDPGIRKFVLIAQGQEFSRPGEIRFKYDDEGASTVLEGNIDFNSDTDFEIEILGAHQLRYDSYVYST